MTTKSHGGIDQDLSLIMHKILENLMSDKKEFKHSKRLIRI